MKHNRFLAITSLLSIVLVTLHLADDIARGMEKGGISTLVAVPILVTWLYGTLMLDKRTSGYIIVILGSLLGMLVPIVHFRGAGGVMGGQIANSSGAFFFVWTLLAIGVTAMFSFVLSALELWRLWHFGQFDEHSSIKR